MTAINIHKLMAELDSRNFNIDGLDQDELKKNIGWLIPQYYTAVTANGKHEKYLESFDQVNHWWKFSTDHPQLALKLLASIGCGGKHVFVKRGKTKDDDLGRFLRDYYPDASIAEIDMCCKLLSDVDLQDMMDIVGLQKKEQDKIWKIRKSYKG